MNDTIEKIWKTLAGGDGDERWHLLPTIVIAVLIAILWHWLHWYAAILVAVGVGIIVQAVMVAVAKRGTDDTDNPPDADLQK